MGKSNGICMLCKTHEEDIHHLFIKCKMIERVWSQLELWLSKLFNVHITVKDKEKCLGIWKEEFKESNYIINLIIIDAKWRIWKNRNSVKYGNENCKLSVTLMNKIRNGVKEDIRIFSHSSLCSKLKIKLKPVIELLI